MQALEARLPNRDPIKLIDAFLKRAPEDGYLRVEGGESDGRKGLHVVLALDYGWDKEALKKEPMPEMHEKLTICKAFLTEGVWLLY